jgi:ATP-dependent DNA helicase DinG
MDRRGAQSIMDERDVLANAHAGLNAGTGIDRSEPRDLQDILGDGGLFSSRIPGFIVREAQIRMAEAIAMAIADKSPLLVEAATGIGKTYAYLVPALLSGQRVVISTGTKPLQDQLFFRDLPVVCETLARSPKTALLKGRNNYLCLQRLEQTQGRGSNAGEVQTLARLDEFARVTSDGDLTQTAWLADGDRLWPLVTSTVDNCLGSNCPRWNGCFVQKARRRAQESEIIVVNHHLLLADLALRDEGFGELLPEADVVIVDEAHQLADVAGQFFGVTVGSRAVQDLVRDLEREIENDPLTSDLRARIVSVEQAAVDGIRVSRSWSGRLAMEQIPNPEPFASMLDNLEYALGDLISALAQVVQSNPGFLQAQQRAQLLRQRLNDFRVHTEDTVAWVEPFAKSYVLHRTPLDAGRPLQERRRIHPGAWIFTSATLAVGEDFRLAAGRLGLDSDVATLRLGSPFDFARHGRLLLPERILPDPSDPEFVVACIDWVWPLLQANPGGGFFLFTSHQALRRAADILRVRLSPNRVLLVQGEQSRAELLRRFEDAGNAWLLGAQTFWEGVDLPGQVLTVVIIDKLPFAVPSDPVLQARSARLAAQGGNPFVDLQLPMAILALKQGIGRLIRGVDDVGVIVLCDPRLRTRPYGRRFLESLPPFGRVDRPEDALAFLEARLNHSTGDSDHAVAGD